MTSSFLFVRIRSAPLYFFFFFNDTATTEIYTLSLHDALPISVSRQQDPARARRLRGDHTPEACAFLSACPGQSRNRDRKSTRLNSSHSQISYAVFCLKKKTQVPDALWRAERPHTVPPHHRPDR